jgi:glycosyltransferase involved in cell wall biosynthesis
MFAGKVFQYLEKLPEQPDLLVAMVPPNFVSHYMRKYKKRHPQVKLVFDIFDLWPETFPSGKAKKLLAHVFSFWAWLRNHSLSCADYITSECDLFRQRLKLNHEKSATVYLCSEPLEFPEIPVSLREDGIDLCYLGSINNIISIADICKLIAQLSVVKPVSLHIIGIGERQQELIDSAQEAGAEVIFYGAVYDDAKKQEVMSRCHFGLNIMKSSVCVGLTMKSVDYFRHGLPIINNIPADTEAMVKGRSVGVCLDENASESILALTVDDMIRMRENVKQLFDQQFSTAVITNRLGLLLDNMLA